MYHNGTSAKCRCLVHVVRSANVRYSKVRPLHPLCQFDVCRHEVRYGCQREDSCSFAHSVIELKCWVLQQDTGGKNTHLLSFQFVKMCYFVKGVKAISSNLPKEPTSTTDINTLNYLVMQIS